VSTAPNPVAEIFYSNALIRITRFMAIVAVAASAAAYALYGWKIAVGFFSGCLIAYLNFHWLKRVVIGLADQVTATSQAKSGRGVVVRFLLRYLLMGLGGYAIFTVSHAALYGLLAGLFLPIAGIACEAVYEVYTALARKF